MEEDDLKRFKEKDLELQNLYELEIKGYIITSKEDYKEGGGGIQHIFHI